MSERERERERERQRRWAEVRERDEKKTRRGKKKKKRKKRNGIKYVHFLKGPITRPEGWTNKTPRGTRCEPQRNQFVEAQGRPSDQDDSIKKINCLFENQVGCCWRVEATNSSRPGQEKPFPFPVTPGDCRNRLRRLIFPFTLDESALRYQTREQHQMLISYSDFLEMNRFQSNNKG